MLRDSRNNGAGDGNDKRQQELRVHEVKCLGGLIFPDNPSFFTEFFKFLPAIRFQARLFRTQADREQDRRKAEDKQ